VGVLFFTHKALHHWHTTQHVLSPAQIKARQIIGAGPVVEHGHFFALHDRIDMQIDGFECSEENQSKLSMAGSVAKTAHASHSAVKKQLRPGIPQQALTAQGHVCFIVKLVGWVWIVWIGGK
jgi:hypothetical protein